MKFRAVMTPAKKLVNRAAHYQLKFKWKRFPFNMAIMLCIMASAVLFSELLRKLDIPDHSLVMVYFLAVLIISRVTPSYAYSIVAAIIGTLAVDYFITAPRMHFSFPRGSPVTLIMMLVATVLTSTLTAQIKEKTRLALEQGQRWQLLSEINEKLLAARNTETIAAIANESLDRYLSPRPMVFYSRDPIAEAETIGDTEDAGDAGNAVGGVEAGNSADAEKAENAERTENKGNLEDAGKAVGGVGVGTGGKPDPAFLRREEQKRVHRIFQRGRAENYAVSDEKPMEIFYLPLLSQESVLGVIGINCRNQPLSPWELSCAHTLAGQVSLALELQKLSDAQSKILIDAEREKTRGALLRSISHDLRTPLTGIIGSGNAILEQRGMDWSVEARLLQDIVETAEWLVRMVENILTVTRFSGQFLAVRKTPEAAEEIIAQAVTIARRRYPDNPIYASAPEKLLIVPMDATLISQVLINLLDNAVKNSPECGPVRIDLKKQGGYARFEVSDDGHGIPAEMMGRLFEAYQPGGELREESTKSRGLGLGLSICKSIINAHGGLIEGHNRDGGGAVFTVLLPLNMKI